MNIVVVDDDKLAATSLKMIIEADPEITVVAVGHSGREAMDLYSQYCPELLLMDIRMEDMTGLEAGRQILQEHPDAKLLFLTTFNDDEYIVQALTMGAKGYLIKQDFESIVPAIKAVMGGQTVFGGDVVEKLPDMLSGSGKKSFDYKKYGLTEQEAAVMECVAEGLSNRECAKALCLSEGTVRNYISNILSKLELRDRTNLAIFYYKNLS